MTSGTTTRVAANPHPRLHYRGDIDGLRAVAVLAVLLYHVGFPWVTGGYVGVDVFFVISGYLITGLIRAEVLATGRFSYANFYQRRIRRLFPALLTTLLGAFIAAAFILPPQLLRSFAQSLVATVFSASNFYFWSQSGYFDTENVLKPLLHTWSLSVEEQFYFLWPLLLVITMLKLPKGAAPLILAALVVLSLAASIIRIDHRSAIYYLLPFRVFELGIGAGLVWLDRFQPRRKWLLDPILLVGLALIAWSILVFNDDTIFPAYNALVPCLGAGLTLYAGRARFAGKLLDNPVAIAIGLISYPLYLVHWPIIVFYKYQHPDGIGFPEMLGICAASIFLAAAIYYLVERQIRQGQLGRSLRGWKLGGVAAVLAILIAAPAVHASVTDGWLWRFDAHLLALLDKTQIDMGLNDLPRGCFMVPTQTSADLPKACYEIDPASTKPNIMLLGDSTAYQLLPGLHALIGDTANLFAWAASVCPPLPGVDVTANPDCRQMMDDFYNRVLPANRYDLVILSSYRQWDALIAGFPAVAQRYKDLGVPFVLVGQAPEYGDSPINLVAKHGAIAGLDEFMRDNLAIGCDDEHGLEALVPADRFFSLKSRICKDGIPQYEDDGVLLYHDRLHFDKAGSILMARRLVDWLRRQHLL